MKVFTEICTGAVRGNAAGESASENNGFNNVTDCRT